jgi:hypothetical protein
MPFVTGYDGATGAGYTTHATPSTEDPTIVLRQVTKGVGLQSITASGRAAAGTTLTGLAFRVRRWTTAGTGGTAITPGPTYRENPTPATTVVDKAAAITAGTVSGAYQGCAFGCGSSTMGSWSALNADSMPHLDGGSGDEFDINSLSGVTVMPFMLSITTVE